MKFSEFKNIAEVLAYFGLDVRSERFILVFCHVESILPLGLCPNIAVKLYEKMLSLPNK